MSRTDRRLGRTVKEIALTAGALVGMICIVAAIASAVLDVRPLVFRSGSMSPTITTGALAIAQGVDASDLEVGDVVMVNTSAGARVTHRIVTITKHSGSATLALRGDANKQPDAQIYEVTRADRVLFDIPKAGYVVGWLAGPIGVFLLGLYAAFLLFVLFGRRDREPGPPRSRGGVRRATGSAAVLLIAIGAGSSGLLVSRASPTLAAWLDPTPATVAGTSLTAHTMVPPSTLRCDTLESGFLGIVKSAQLTFTNSDPRYTHVIELAQTATGAATSTTLVPPASGGSKTSVVQDTGLLGGLNSTTAYVRVYSAIGTPGPSTTWKTTEYREWSLSVNLLSGYVSCGASVM